MSSTRQLLFSIYPLIFILFLCIPFIGKAQTCTPVYKKMYGGIGIDEGLDIVRTTDNGSIVAGRTSSDAANTNSFLMKLNEQGSIQWVKSYGGSQYDEFVKVKQARDGGYVAIGNTKSFGQTSGEPFLVRTDANGNILWSRKLNRNGVPAKAKSLVTLSDGGFAVGINLNDSTAQGDGFIVRTTAAGTILWSKRFDQGGNDGVHTLLEDGNSLVVSGYTTIDFFDAVLMKLNLNDGSVIWSKRFVRHDGLDDQCLNVQKIPGGYAFGVISGFNNGPFNRDGALLTLFKMKEDGTIFFQRGTELGTPSGHTIEFADIRFTADSGFLIMINDTLIKKNGTYKKMSASGLTEWGRAPSEWDELNSISGADLFDSRGYLLTGACRGNTFGDNAVTKTIDVQVLKTDVFGSFGPCTGNKYGASTDTVIFTYSGPFTWKSQHSETVDPDLITLASAPLNFTETLDCETQDCKPVSTDITDKCFASFMAHYSEKYKFVPFDALKVRDGYIMSGYVMHYWSIEPRVVKLNLNGTVAWAKTFNNYIHNASFQKLFLTDDGNILLTGPDDYTIDHYRYTSTTFVKITPGGEVLWAKYVDGSMSDLKPVGNGVFAGIMLYNLTGGSVSAAMFKIDASGNVLYFKRLSTPYEYIPTYLKIAFDGNYMYASGELHEYTVIEKLDSSGKRIWQKRFKPEDKTAKVQSLYLLGDSVYVTATVYTPDGFWSSKGNLALLKVHKDGSGLNGVILSKPDMVLDYETYYFWPQTWISHVTKTDDNNFVLVDRIKDGADSVVSITKFSPAGVVLWSKKFPGLTQHKIMGVRDDEGSLLLTGYQIVYNDPYYGTSTNAMLTRTNSKGEIIEANNSECSAVPGEAAFVKLNLVEIYSSEAPVPTFQYTNFAIVPFKPLERTFEVASNLGCSVPSNCTTLKISGPGSICNQIETVLYKTVRNPGCVLPATWVYDTAMVRLITATDTTLSVQFKRAGSAKIVAKYSTGCGTLNDTISVHVAPMAGAFSLGQDTAICPGNTFLLKAGEGFLSYKWQDGSVDSNFTVTAPGLYHVNVTDLCGRSYADSVRVNQRPPVPFVVSEDRMKCNDDTLRFVAPSGFLNYTWSSSNDNVSIAGRDVVVNPPVNTVYYVKAEKTPGCYAYDTIRVAVNHSPAIDLGLDQSFCSGDSVTFDAGAGFSSYTWSTGDTLSKITVRALGPYRIKATTAQGCSSFDTVFVRDVWGLPDARLDKRAGLCTGEIRTLNPGNFQSYIWQDGSTAPTYKVSAPGRYFVQVKDLHGCKGYDSTNIKDVSSLPSNFLPLDTMLCSYSTLVIKPVSNYKSYLWNEGSRTEKVSIGQPGTYWLQVEDNNGCIGKDSITVHPKECISGVYVPNAFSPNKDRKNDLFSAQVFGHVAKFELIVYNRWGRVVFRTTNPTKGWDGRFSGIEQDSGTFIWMCRYRLESEPEKMVKGTVVLIR